MSDNCATKTICVEPTDGNPSGTVVINEEDFDPATMQEYGVEQPQLQLQAATAAKPAKAPKATAPVEATAAPVAPWAAK